MGNLLAGTTPQRSSESSFDSGAAVTRSLLGYGVLAGPFYLAVGLIQAFVRNGFDLARHPLSVLANGPGGWVQTANFVLTGLMVLAAASGFARVLGPKSRATSWFLGAFGASMIVAAVFRADPMDGFPIGTPEGPPTSISSTGMTHFIAEPWGSSRSPSAASSQRGRCRAGTYALSRAFRSRAALLSCWASSAARR